MRTIHVQVKSADVAAELCRIDAYLYSNFAVASHSANPAPDEHYSTVVVNGHDNAGWTAEAQSDRLWSGLIGAKVVR